MQIKPLDKHVRKVHVCASATIDFLKRTFAEMIQNTNSCFSLINSMRQTFVIKQLNSAGDRVFHSSWMQESEEPGQD